jgi:hypothetical protein
MKTDLPQVRIATRNDENEVMEMCRALWKENGLFTMNEDKVRACLHKCYDRSGAIVGVIGEPGHIEASTCLMISDFYYSDDWHLAELWNYVAEPFRKSRNAEALIEFGKSCSDKMKVPFFTGIITNSHMAGKVRMYRRLLGAPTGAFFLYNGNWKTRPMEDHRELRGRLREFAQTCTGHSKSVSFAVVRKEIAPLLREAADALATDDDLFGAPHGNGAALGG